MSSGISHAIIICGGEGTRLRPLTYKIPKPLVPVNGTAVIDEIVSELVRNGINNITLAVGYKSEMFMEHFGSGSSFGVSVDYSIETEPLGTGGAIKKALSENVKPSNDDVLVISGDNIIEIDVHAMYALHLSNSALATIAVRRVPDITGYGVVTIESNRIKEFVEKPDPSNAKSDMINMGVYILNGRILGIMPEMKRFSIEKDFFEKVMDKEIICAYETYGLWLPIDTPERYEKACNEWNAKMQA